MLWANFVKGVNMVKSSSVKKVGTISDEVVERYKLYDYRNTDIMQYLSLYIHIAK